MNSQCGNPLTCISIKPTRVGESQEVDGHRTRDIHFDGRHAGGFVDHRVVVQGLPVEVEAEAAGAGMEGDEEDEWLADVDRNVRLKRRQLEARQWNFKSTSVTLIGLY